MNARSLRVIGWGFLLVVAMVVSASASALAAPQATPVNETAQIGRAAPAAQTAPGPKTFDLCATTGSVTMPDGTSHNIWGFVSGSACSPGDATLPGPELRAVAGDSVTINLTNNLATPVSILVPGQDVTATSGAQGTFTAEAPANGGTVSYTFIAKEGSYLYESGTNADVQVAMGLYGALIVESATAGQAYGNTYDQEAVLVLGEIDPNLNANPAGFNMQDYHPVYWLINGQAYPDTSPLLSANAGEKVLLRYLNAGYKNLSMALLGAHQTLIAKEGYATPAAVDLVAEIVAAGQTMETIVDTAGLSGPLALYNRNMYVSNGVPGTGHYPGGMLTFLDVQGAIGTAPAASIAEPADGSTVAGAAVPIGISASDVEDDANLGAGKLTVEWRFAGALTWQTATWDGAQYAASWDTTALPDGPITLEARATDMDLNTSSTSIGVTVDNIDEAPSVNIFDPVDSDLVTGSITIQATASDDHSVTQVEFFDGTTSLGADTDGSDGWSALWNTASDGSHTLEARATDDGANTSSDFINVTVDNTAPLVSITAPTDGAIVSGPVAITASASDATSGVTQVEFFVDGGSIGVDSDGGDGWSADWDTVDLNAGPYSLTARATDGAGLSAISAAVSVTVDNPPLSTLHAGDLDATVAIQNPGQNNERWTATVTVDVHDALDDPVNGATVDFEVSWINRNNGNTQSTTLNCLTDAAGECQVSRQFQSNNTEDIVWFAVTGISHASLTYEPLDNHDPDGPGDPEAPDNVGSDGTTLYVEVQRP